MAEFGDINRWELTGRMARDAEVQESNGRKRLRLRSSVFRIAFSADAGGAG